MSQLRVLSAVIACASAAVIGVSTLTPAFAADMNTPDYAEVEASFVREQTDADFRSQYHYAPVFQPVENQCANVMQGKWARVNCWTDDGDNMIVRVEVCTVMALSAYTSRTIRRRRAMVVRFELLMDGPNATSRSQQKTGRRMGNHTSSSR